MPFNRRMTNTNQAHIHNVMLFISNEKEKITFAGKWVEQEGIIQSEITKTKSHMLYLTHPRFLATNL